MKKKYIFYAIAIVVVLFILYLAGKQAAGIVGGILAVFGFGKGAINKKRKKVVEEANKEEKIIEDIEKRQENRDEIAEKLKETDGDTVKEAHKLIEKDKKIEVDIADLRNRLDKLKKGD